MNPILLRSRALLVLVAFLVSSAPPQVPARSAENQRGPSLNSSVQTFINVNPITINDNSTATPYPSTIAVSGVNPASVTHVRVVLYGFTHAFPDDVDIVLVGPQGQRAILMSDAGGGNSVSGLQFAFEQTATATTLPDSTALTGGGTTYRPANYYTGPDNFPAPGPGELNFAPADLSVFSATNPNGVWSLYVVDDFNGDAGVISEGWDLVITVPTVFTVTKIADTNDGVCNADCSLREAITAAQNGDLINFSALFNTPQTINLLSALPDITKSVTIQGAGAHLLTVQRDYNAPNFRIFNILDSIANGVAISGLTISNGHAGLFGGGISSQSRLTLTNVDVSGNQASSGGGVSLSFADGTFTGCTFSANTVVGSGGAIFYEGDGGFTLRLANSTVSGNRAGDGGIVNVSNSGQSRLEVTSCTIVNNAAGSSGLRTLASGASSNATTTLRNSIIANNTPANLGSQGTGGGTTTVTTLGFNLSDDFNGVTPAGSDITTATPRLGPLSLNAGTTPTHALLGGSPALNAGEASGLATDQRGVPRVFGASADIGAVEMQSILVLNANDAGSGSLREAVSTANSSPDLNDIIFDNAVFSTPQTINLTDGLFISGSATLNGPGANLLTVRRSDSGANFGIFDIATSLANVAISGMTISNGRGVGAGGGIVSGSPLTLTNVHVTGNQAEQGGGVSMFGTDGIFTGCIFSGNRSNSQGGGIDFRGAGGRTLRVVSSTVSGNSAGSFGGGISNFSDSGRCQLDVINSTLAGNIAPTGGGIATLTQSTGNTASTTLRNTIIADNSTTNLATATFSGGGPATFTSFGFNLANDNGGGFLTGPSDKINAFAGLGPLQNNGGPTPTQALLRNSAALDAGNNSGALFDQRGPGFARTTDYTNIANVSDGTDIGAIEGTALTITSITRLTNGHIFLQGFGAPGLTYTIEANGNPAAPNGLGGSGGIIPDGTGAFSFEDPSPVTLSLTKRFYRVHYP